MNVSYDDSSGRHIGWIAPCSTQVQPSAVSETGAGQRGQPAVSDMRPTVLGGQVTVKCGQEFQRSTTGVSRS